MMIRIMMVAIAAIALSAPVLSAQTKTPAPILFHPYMLYAMGLLAAEVVPEVSVFEDQAQFNPTSIATPSVGTVIDRPDARDSAARSRTNSRAAAGRRTAAAAVGLSRHPAGRARGDAL